MDNYSLNSQIKVMQEKLAEFEVKNNKLESQLKKINDQAN